MSKQPRIYTASVKQMLTTQLPYLFTIYIRSQADTAFSIISADLANLVITIGNNKLFCIFLKHVRKDAPFKIGLDQEIKQQNAKNPMNRNAEEIEHDVPPKLQDKLCRLGPHAHPQNPASNAHQPPIVEQEEAALSDEWVGEDVPK